MSNALAIFQDQNAGDMELAPQFRALVNSDMGGDLSGGVGGNYGIVSIKGGKWRIKFRGEEYLVRQDMNDPDSDPKMSLEVVIVKANKFLTKQYYENGYQEGDSSPPTCYSVDGVVPAPGVENPQHNKCALCPKNAFGSRIANRDDGTVSKAKACADNRKTAVVPLSDLRNEAFGGPMLLRIPPSALKDLATFGQTMQARGYPYNAVAVRIGFDTDVSHPKPTFRAIRPLTSEEADIVLELAASDLTERVLADFNVSGEAPAAETPPPQDDAFEQPPAVQTPPPAAKPAVKPAAARPTAPAAKPGPPAAKAPAKAATPAAPAKVPGPPAARKGAAAPPPAQDVPASVAGEVITDAEVVEANPAPGGLDDEISNILAGLNAVA